MTIWRLNLQVSWTLCWTCDDDIEVSDLASDFEFMFVRWKKLELLFRFCMECGSSVSSRQYHIIGATVFVTLECTAGHRVTWDSMDYGHKKCNDHALLSSAIVLSGSTYTPFSEAMQIAKVSFLSEKAFYTIQKDLIFPAINNVYQRKAREILERAKNQGPVSLIGDGRCDSPGFSAKFGTYTLMNETDNERIN